MVCWFLFLNDCEDRGFILFKEGFRVDNGFIFTCKCLKVFIEPSFSGSIFIPSSKDIGHIVLIFWGDFGDNFIIIIFCIDEGIFNSKVYEGVDFSAEA